MSLLSKRQGFYGEWWVQRGTNINRRTFEYQKEGGNAWATTLPPTNIRLPNSVPIKPIFWQRTSLLIQPHGLYGEWWNQRAINFNLRNIWALKKRTINLQLCFPQIFNSLHRVPTKQICWHHMSLLIQWQGLNGEWWVQRATNFHRRTFEYQKEGMLEPQLCLQLIFVCLIQYR